MLQIFADKERNKKIMIGIFICILPGFLLWGTSSVIKSAKEKPLPGVMIFGKRVPAEDLSQAIQAVRMQTMMQFGDSFSQVEK
ncbi:MAG TPA: SurA N-terminal domain-containing protein, partial [Candidatus Omnitrophota bacterium]|nr:SurA N-terminal domain-containing protein [Candidatus Omnitrophota bacterium]